MALAAVRLATASRGEVASAAQRRGCQEVADNLLRKVVVRKAGRTAERRDSGFCCNLQMQEVLSRFQGRVVAIERIEAFRNPLLLKSVASERT